MDSGITRHWTRPAALAGQWQIRYTDSAMDIHVRELNQGEGLVWRDLRLRALLDSPDAFGMTYEVESLRPDNDWHQRIDERVADSWSTSLIAEINDKPGGIAGCGFDVEDQSLCGLYAMWVAPEFRGAGVGRALVTYALKWMKSRGARTAQLSVTERNDAAFSLYTSSGFKDTEVREPLREGSAKQVIVMRRTLG